MAVRSLRGRAFTTVVTSRLVRLPAFFHQSDRLVPGVPEFFTDFIDTGRSPSPVNRNSTNSPSIPSGAGAEAQPEVLRVGDRSDGLDVDRSGPGQVQHLGPVGILRLEPPPVRRPQHGQVDRMDVLRGLLQEPGDA